MDAITPFAARLEQTLAAAFEPGAGKSCVPLSSFMPRPGIGSTDQPEGAGLEELDRS